MMNGSERGSVLLAALIVALVLGITRASLVIFSAANTAASQDALRRAEALTAAWRGRLLRGKPSDLRRGRRSKVWSDHAAIEQRAQRQR